MEADDALQQRLLSKLNEYGDSFLDEEDYQQNKKRAKVKSQPTNGQSSQRPLTQTSTSVAGRKKKKKKKAAANLDDARSADRKGKGQSLLNFDEEIRQFREETLAKERREKEAESKEERGGKRSQPEVIVFEDPSRRKKKKLQKGAKTEMDADEFNLRRARHEVRQYGLRGFSYEDQEKCEADRAISLGAWAPKREYINYKDFTVIQKKKKEEERLQREVDRKMGYSVAKKTSSEKLQVRNHGFWKDATQDKKFFLDGQVGRYKQGVQVVSKGDIAKTKAKTKRGSRGGKTNKLKL